MSDSIYCQSTNKLHVKKYIQKKRERGWKERKIERKGRKEGRATGYG